MEVIPEYNVAFSPRAQEDLAYFKKSGNIPLQKKITKLIKELEEHPTYGTGQCEALKYDLSGYWSRRITDEHRLLYQIDETEHVVYVYRLRGHY